MNNARFRLAISLRQEHPRLSDVSQGPGWWEASDGKWYPPKESEHPPAPGFWLAADGRWYPPEEHPDLAPEEPQIPHVRSAASQPSVPAAIEAPDQTTPPTSKAVAGAHGSQPGPGVPGRTGGVAADRAPRTVAQAAGAAMPVRRRSVDATDQIRTRNDASRQDALAQAPARFLAAARALQALESELEASAPAPTATAPASSPDTTSAAAPAATRSKRPDASSSPPPPPAPPTLVSVPAPPAAVASRFDGPEPLLELRTSPLGADVDHIGDRVLVFEDRVELRDRLDRIRQRLAGDQITDVVIQRKFTGAVLIVEGGDGTSILTRGLRPEQAEEAKVLIHKRTRGGRPAHPRVDPTPVVPAATPATAAASDPLAPAPTPGAQAGPTSDDRRPTDANGTAARMAQLNQGRLNEADLLRKLADLHRAGVLSDAEFEDKIALVGQLVAGESLVIR